MVVDGFVAGLQSVDLLDSLDVENLLGEVVKQLVAADADGEETLEQAPVGMYRDTAQQAVAALVDDRGDGCDDADVVLAQDLQGDEKLAAGLACPSGADDAVGVAAPEVVQVFAVGAVDLDGAVAGDEALDAVPEDGVAALGEPVVDALDVLTDDQDVAVVPWLVLIVVLLQDELLGGASCGSRRRSLADGFVLLDDVADVDGFFLDGDIELGGGLESHLLDDAGQDGVFGFDFAVLEAPLQGLARQQRLVGAPLVDGIFDLVARAAGGGDAQPVEARRLC